MSGRGAFGEGFNTLMHVCKKGVVHQVVVEVVSSREVPSLISICHISKVALDNMKCRWIGFSS